MAEKFFICNRFKVEEVSEDSFLKVLNGEKENFLKHEKYDPAVYAILIKDCAHNGEIVRPNCTGRIISFSSSPFTLHGRKIGESGVLLGFVKNGESLSIVKKLAKREVVTGIKRNKDEIVLLDFKIDENGLLVLA